MDHLSLQQKIIVQFVEKNGQITSHQAEMLLEVKQRRARTILKKMVDQGILERYGSYKNTVYKLKESTIL
jgi:ATP-dependent DNA helicase RecG